MTESLDGDSFEPWPSLNQAARQASAIVIAEVARIERLISHPDLLEKSRLLNDFSARQIFAQTGQAQTSEDLATAAAIAIVSLALHFEAQHLCEQPD